MTLTKINDILHIEQGQNLGKLTKKQKELDMEIIFNKELNGWQIVYLKTAWRNPILWGKPVNDKIYDSWDSASHDLDKWAE